MLTLAKNAIPGKICYYTMKNFFPGQGTNFFWAGSKNA